MRHEEIGEHVDDVGGNELTIDSDGKAFAGGLWIQSEYPLRCCPQLVSKKLSKGGAALSYRYP